MSQSNPTDNGEGYGNEDMDDPALLELLEFHEGGRMSEDDIMVANDEEGEDDIMAAGGDEIVDDEEEEGGEEEEDSDDEESDDEDDDEGEDEDDDDGSDDSAAAKPQANGGLSEYERLRQERIARNNARLAELGFDDKPKKVKKKVVPQRKSLDEFAVRRQNPDRARRATTFNEDELLMDIGLKVDKRDKPPSRGLEPPPINWGKTPTGKLKKCGKCDGCMRENNCETCVACVSYPGKVKCIFKKCQGWTDDANEDGKESDEEEEEEEEDHHDTECNVCQDGGDLICCDSCHRSYHSDCHKPKIWDVPKKGDKWICMVCRKEQKALQFYKPKYGCPLIADLGGGKEVKCNVQFPKLECIVCEEVEVTGVFNPPDWLTCRACDDCYHLKCHDPPLESKPHNFYRWRCRTCAEMNVQIKRTEEEIERSMKAKRLKAERKLSKPLFEGEHSIWCFMCDDGGDMICCDYCEKSYHLECHIPPLIEIPAGLWKCQECAAVEYTRMMKCGECRECLSEDCGVCGNCLDKPKFGGPNTKKRTCVHKKCKFMRFAPPTKVSAKTKSNEELRLQFAKDALATAKKRKRMDDDSDSDDDELSIAQWSDNDEEGCDDDDDDGPPPGTVPFDPELHSDAPIRPKNSPNQFSLFCKDAINVMPELLEGGFGGPGKMTERTRAIANKWNTMDDNEKKKYKDLAATLSEEHDKLMQQYRLARKAFERANPGVDISKLHQSKKIKSDRRHGLEPTVYGVEAVKDVRPSKRKQKVDCDEGVDELEQVVAEPEPTPEELNAQMNEEIEKIINGKPLADDPLGNKIRLTIVKALKDPTDSKVQDKACEKLRSLAVTADNVLQIISLGGLKMLTKAMRDHPDKTIVQAEASALLTELVWVNPQCIKEVNTEGCLQLVLASMQQHETHVMVQKMGCGFLRAVSYDFEYHRSIDNWSGVSAIIHSMKRNRKKYDILIEGCLFIQNILSNPMMLGTVQSILLQDSFVPIIVDAMVDASSVYLDAACGVLVNLALIESARSHITNYQSSISSLLTVLESNTCEEACKCSLISLKLLSAGNDDTKAEIVSLGAIGKGVDFVKSSNDDALLDSGLKLLSELIKDNTVNAQLLADLGGFDLVTSKMSKSSSTKLKVVVNGKSIDTNVPYIQASCCGILRHLPIESYEKAECMSKLVLAALNKNKDNKLLQFEGGHVLLKYCSHFPAIAKLLQPKSDTPTSPPPLSSKSEDARSKRKPGRPKKFETSDSPPPVSSKSEDVQVKRKPGRPKKIVASASPSPDVQSSRPPPQAARSSLRYKAEDNSQVPRQRLTVIFDGRRYASMKAIDDDWDIPIGHGPTDKEIMAIIRSTPPKDQVGSKIRLVIVKALQGIPMTKALIDMDSDDSKVQDKACELLRNRATNENDASTIIRYGGLKMISKAMRDYPEKTIVQAEAIALLTALVWVYPQCLSNIIDEGILLLVIASMQRHEGNPKVQQLGCGLFRTISYDFSNHWHIDIVYGVNGVGAVIDSMQRTLVFNQVNQISAARKHDIMKEGCFFLQNILGNPDLLRETIQQVVSSGITLTIIDSILAKVDDDEYHGTACGMLANLALDESGRQHIADYDSSILTLLKVIGLGVEEPSKCCLTALKLLASGSDDSKGKIVRLGGVKSVLELLRPKGCDVDLVDSGLGLLSELTKNSSNISQLLLDLDGFECVMKMMAFHSSSSYIQVRACDVICNLPIGAKEAARATELILKAMKYRTESMVQYEGCRALLHCCHCSPKMAELLHSNEVVLRQSFFTP